MTRSPGVKADVGAIATQAQVNTTYGPNGLLLMAQGKNAFDTLKILTDADPQKVFRQAFIYVVAQARETTDDLNKLERIRAAWETFFSESTEGRGTMIARLR